MNSMYGKTDPCKWKVRRMPGSKHSYQVCHFDEQGNAEVIPGFWNDLKAAQEFADAMNEMAKGVQEVV